MAQVAGRRADGAGGALVQVQLGQLARVVQLARGNGAAGAGGAGGARGAGKKPGRSGHAFRPHSNSALQFPRLI